MTRQQIDSLIHSLDCLRVAKAAIDGSLSWFENEETALEWLADTDSPKDILYISKLHCETSMAAIEQLLSPELKSEKTEK